VGPETRISFLFAMCRPTQPRYGVDPSVQSFKFVLSFCFFDDKLNYRLRPQPVRALLHAPAAAAAALQLTL